jgi:hypothetical protein
MAFDDEKISALKAEIQRLRELVGDEEKLLSDAPAYFNGDEAFGWACGWNTLRDRLLTLLAVANACPDCEGNGFYVTEVTINECCGHGTPSGECCGCPVAGVEQEQVGCERCQATGKISPHHIPIEVLEQTLKMSTLNNTPTHEES